MISIFEEQCMKKTVCKDCGRQLSNDEIALTKKIIYPKAKEFL